jgi:hypothetical protein
MKTISLIVLNIGLVGVFVFLLRQRNLLSFSQNGRIWLTYLAVAIITLMAEFTSVFYAPAEAYRFIDLSAIIVDYILTACISAVSAVANASSF